jgi:hypothetical protein
MLFHFFVYNYHLANKGIFFDKRISYLKRSV